MLKATGFPEKHNTFLSVGALTPLISARCLNASSACRPRPMISFKFPYKLQDIRAMLHAYRPARIHCLCAAHPSRSTPGLHKKDYGGVSLSLSPFANAHAHPPRLMSLRVLFLHRRLVSRGSPYATRAAQSQAAHLARARRG